MRADGPDQRRRPRFWGADARIRVRGFVSWNDEGD